MRHVRVFCHNTLTEYAMGNSVAPKNHQMRGSNDRLGWVCKACASSLFHTSSHGLHTSAAVYVGKTSLKNIAQIPNLLHCIQRSAYEVLGTILGT